MVLPADQAPPGVDWIARRFAALEQQIRQVAAGRRLESATIGEGGLTIDGGKLLIDDDGQVQVLHSNGMELFNAGPALDSIGEPVEQVLFRRPDGTAQFWAFGRKSDGYGFLAFYDITGNIIISDDANSRQGLARPYIPGGQFVSMSTPTDTTSATAFTPLQKAIWVKQHPYIKLWALTNCTATSAEIQWRINSGPDAGTVIGGPIGFGVGFGYAVHGPYALPGDHMSEIEIDVDCRVVSGTGTVGVRMLGAIGMQSP